MRAENAALTAAAEVNWPSQELVNDLVASATEEDSATVHYPLGKPAEVGEITPLKDQAMWDAYWVGKTVEGQTEARTIDPTKWDAVLVALDRNATIERCAQVADSFRYGGYEQIADAIAAAIRALKE